MKKKRTIKILALALAFCFIFTTVAFAAPKHNKIDKKIKDYEGALKSLIQKEIVKGYGNGDYGLSGNVKRGDVIVMIVRMLDQYGVIDEDDYDAEKLSENYLEIFEDVDNKDYYYGHIRVAKMLGIAKGDGKYFKPNTPVTIQETIWLIERTGDLLDIKFNSDQIEELKEIYKGDLGDFAKRSDVFWMLYLILDDIDEDEEDDDYDIADIKHTMNDDETFKFTDKMFLRAFGDDLEYVKFTLPENGNLYYDYDADASKNSLVSESKKYFIYDDDLDDELRISEITFKPKDNFNGQVNIEYKAYDEDKAYNGLIVITVEKNEDFDDIKYTVKENNNLKFDYRSFDSRIDEVVFTLLDKKIGTLYFDDDKDGKLEDDENLAKNEAISRSDLRYVYFVPYQDYKGEAIISYVGYDGKEEFDGRVVVTVESVQEISTLSLVKKIRDGEAVIDFEDNLYETVGKDLYNKLDYVKFVLPSKGQLMIKYDEGEYKSVAKDAEYVIGKIEEIKYIFDGRGTVDINYTVFDEDTSIEDKAYDGLITLKIQ
ncbi:S-layer homology domain-containing protein [Sedimentibacter sp.]|uniref:S-layer homology domain-containing protein n=1 Tax=Sedimentibacter sp. TaxID=1960295 RepID=UPI0028B16CBA|nr:S-layer homology domain-containing protein [Sedimentibacter sp.]